MKQKIAAALAARHPELKTYQVEKIVEKYLTVMLGEIAESVRKFGIEDDQFSLSLNDLRKKIGRVNVNGKSQWACQMLNASPATSLVLIDFKGNEGKSSRVSFNPIYEADVFVALVDFAYDVETGTKVGQDQNWTVCTPVTLQGLDSFIEQTRISLQHTKGDQNNDAKNAGYRIKLLRNLLDAQRIRQLIFEENGSHWLGQNYEEADSGRLYGQGVNLQRVSKEVRHAVLGQCHMYDIKAASYALLTSLALEINPELEVSEIVDYVKNRTQIRKSIATEVGISEMRMKAIFTSLGFGARTANTPYASIRKSLGAKAHQALMNNEQFVAIKDAMDRVRATVAAYFPQSFGFVGGRYYSDQCPRTGKKRTADQKLAWIYQAMEADAITCFGQLAQEAGQQPILFVHDCVYFKNKLPDAVLERAFDELRVMYQLVSVDHEKIYPIHTADYEDPDYAAARQQEDEHKLLMKRLEAEFITEVSEDWSSRAEPRCEELEQLMTALHGRIGSVSRCRVSGQGDGLGISVPLFNLV